MNFFDCNIHLDQFASPKSVLREILYFNIKKVVSLSNSSSAFNFLNELFGNQKEVLLGVGLHPNKSYSIQETRKIIHIMKCKVRIIGECGLDFYSKNNIFKKQIENLQSQFEIAEKYDKILILHVRKAEDKILEIIDSYNLNNVVFHWYSGPVRLIEKFLERDIYFSFNKCILVNKKYFEIIFKIPMDSLILESDAPFKYRGLVTNPSDFPLIANKISEIKSIEIESVNRQLNCNFKEIFH